MGIAKNAEVIRVELGDYEFGIHKFGAFKAANLSGELVAMFAPMLSALVPELVKEVKEEKKSGVEKSIMDTELEDMAPAIAGAFNTLKGDNVEKLLVKLLCSKNIFVKETGEDAEDGEWLTMDLADSIFAGNVQDMFVLAAKVIACNYQGFFEKLGIRSGAGAGKMIVKTLMK